MNINTIHKNTDLHTGIEIAAQPALWQEVYDLIADQKEKISNFISPLLGRNDLRIILTGAGSSAYLCEAAQSHIQQVTGRIVQTIPTTDIVTHPEAHFVRDIPTLLVSFARSGNSPESVETVKLADSYCKEIYHLIITCNKEGALALYAKKDTAHSLSLVLPDKTNDKSLVMTSSFTCMLLSGILIADIKNIGTYASTVSKMVALGTEILEKKSLFEQVATQSFDRVVFLGSGDMLGIARECHLKVQELTDGQIICKHDSFLGFRHGPRAVVKENTLIVYLFSGNKHAQQYERDLALDIAKDTQKMTTMSFGVLPDLNNNINVCENEQNKLAVVPATLMGQLLGYYKCIALNLNPDNPSVNGAISRVVQGVNIYIKK